MATLATQMQQLTLRKDAPRAVGSRVHVAGTRLGAVSASRPAVFGSSFEVVAKQNSLKRSKQNAKRRMYNKSHKSAVATRMKKAMKALDAWKAAPTPSADDLSPVDQLISEAYKEIDKCVVKGILHLNTASRRKSRLARAKQRALVDTGLYTPQA
mmetsp:Transcript_11142/g.68626  ORF Transcript_11142/g.68626 Transcript_11142/m.68626 type:complete len:155 (+) Transcript_11142:73-537(+)|eukprot:CAMPEP_0183833546 /NCGR_PEP_ID=MMETSP0807_2-20130328/6129_1 /TAXON_ID=88271 /ORGANISM="Picocystis salinarum, Strain CCMP1897" /LENGTH=154 /DNA_ID=CAMNT_0026079505 /DNA_START=33 /DNA_END=497 /DNA_ORIENTATION=-